MRILHSLSILIVFIFHTFYVFADLNEGYAFRSLDINNGFSRSFDFISKYGSRHSSG